MIDYGRLFAIVTRAEHERCKSISDEYSCGNSVEECKKCVMKALDITEVEYRELFDAEE